MRQKRLLSLIFVLIVAFKTFGQDSHPLQNYIDKWTAGKTFKTANISISTIDLSTQKEIAGHRSSKVLTPASSLKLFTTLTALKLLGEDFEYKTIIGYTGSINAQGELEGDLIIKGSGDPTLGSKEFSEILDFEELLDHIYTVVYKSGINCIQGGVIVDESVFDSYPVSPSWQWNDLGNYYASGAWGLNVSENIYTVYFNKRKTIGSRPNIHSTYPRVPELYLSNEIIVDSAHTGDQAYIFGGPYNNNKRIVGTIPQGTGLFSIKGSIPDPPLFFAYHVKEKLQKQNIQVQEIKTIYRATRKKKRINPIDTIFSPKLAEIISKANKESNNLYTEAILKTIGLKQGGMGSGQMGIRSIKKELRKNGVSTKSLHFHDGSGLSARNLVSSYALAKFLAGISRSIPIDELKQYLPKGGYSGTVRGLFKNSKAKGNVWLKSGSMEAIISYTGFVKNASGNWVSFSVIVNGYSQKSSTIRSKIEQLIIAIYQKS